MTSPPTVPCDPIDAAAIREINESCSLVVNSPLNDGKIVIGEFRSVVGVIAVDICKKNSIIIQKSWKFWE